MKNMLVMAWAWVLAHPQEVLSTIVGFIGAIAALSIVNARKTGKPVGALAVFVDRAAARTRADAVNKGWSLPGIGYSVFATAQEIKAESDAEAEHATKAPPSPDASASRSSAGFVDRSVMMAVGGVFLLALGVSLLSGCPRMPAAEGCASGAVRCSERGVPQLCDSQGRWTPMDDQCSTHEAQCCVTAAYSARTIAVCLPMSEVCHAAQ